VPRAPACRVGRGQRTGKQRNYITRTLADTSRGPTDKYFYFYNNNNTAYLQLPSINFKLLYYIKVTKKPCRKRKTMDVFKITSCSLAGFQTRLQQLYNCNGARWPSSRSRSERRTMAQKHVALGTLVAVHYGGESRFRCAYRVLCDGRKRQAKDRRQ